MARLNSAHVLVSPSLSTVVTVTVPRLPYWPTCALPVYLIGLDASNASHAIVPPRKPSHVLLGVPFSSLALPSFPTRRSSDLTLYFQVTVEPTGTKGPVPVSLSVPLVSLTRVMLGCAPK